MHTQWFDREGKIQVHPQPEILFLIKDLCGFKVLEDFFSRCMLRVVIDISRSTFFTPYATIEMCSTACSSCVWMEQSTSSEASLKTGGPWTL